MKALSIREPYAWEIIMGDKTIEYRTWLPGKVSTFLLVSTATPSVTDFGLGLPNGYALAIIKIDAVSGNKSHGGYSWHVSVENLVKPFPVKGRLHFYQVDDAKIETLPHLLDSLMVYREDKGSKKTGNFVEQYVNPLLKIGYGQMPKKYRKIIERTGDWHAAAETWYKSRNCGTH
ncbi:ASCH domain-containing protein [Lentilactobacillus hilgardii]|nr:ASCH domain-containing protein [Lentilactobacillus hilgardii]